MWHPNVFTLPCPLHDPPAPSNRKSPYIAGPRLQKVVTVEKDARIHGNSTRKTYPSIRQFQASMPLYIFPVEP